MIFGYICNKQIKYNIPYLELTCPKVAQQFFCMHPRLVFCHTVMAYPKTQSFGRSSSISDATASLDPKPTIDYGFTSSDKAILSDYSYAAYAITPGAFKRGLEPVLLTTIVGSSNHELDDGYLSLDKCSSLLRRNPQFRALLLSCWKDGSFQLVREAGE